MSAKPPSTPLVLTTHGTYPPRRGPTCAYCGRQTPAADAARGECAGCGAPVLIGPRETITVDDLREAVANAKGTAVWG